MNNLTISYFDRKVTVSPEVAEYIGESDRQIDNNDRKYRRHNIRLWYFRNDNAFEGKHCLAKDNVPNTVLQKLKSDVVQNALSALPEHLQRLYYLRYELDLTQQSIADIEGISKMAVSKRQKKLHEQVKAGLPDWPVADFVA